MAANFTVIGSYATVQVTGPTTAVDVLRITFRTIPSGVVAVANAPYKNLVGVQPGDVAGIADTFIAPLATGIERMMGSGLVSSAVASEDTDPSGLLIDYIDATVEYDPPGAGQGSFTQVVRLPTNAFDEPSFYDPLIGAKLNAAHDGLVALAGE
jgi:hypothetical protein